MSHIQNENYGESINSKREDDNLPPLSLSQAIELVFNGHDEVELPEQFLSDYIL